MRRQGQWQVAAMANEMLRLQPGEQPDARKSVRRALSTRLRSAGGVGEGVDGVGGAAVDSTAVEDNHPMAAVHLAET
jgi:hypothetical protein